MPSYVAFLRAINLGATRKFRVEDSLGRAFLADRGFEVPTIVLTPAQVCDVVRPSRSSTTRTRSWSAAGPRT